MSIKYGQEDLLVEKTGEKYSPKGHDADGKQLFLKVMQPNNITVRRRDLEFPVIFEGEGAITAENTEGLGFYLVMMNTLAKHTLPENASIAMLGAGTLILLPLINKMASWGTKHIYELVPEIKEWNQHEQEGRDDGWTWKIGDWEKQLKSKYDVIVFDVGQAVTDERRTFLESKLNQGGIIIE